MSAKHDPTISPAPAATELPKPYLKPDGTLVIPFASNLKYHYWKPGGQKLAKTREELLATNPPPPTP